jgi:hypothetical protein
MATLPNMGSLEGSCPSGVYQFVPFGVFFSYRLLRHSSRGQKEVLDDQRLYLNTVRLLEKTQPFLS